LALDERTVAPIPAIDMNKPLRALLVEDSEEDAELLLAEIRRGGYDVTWERVETAEALRAALERQPWDVVVADYKMPHFSGLAALELLKASRLDLPFIIVSGTIGEEMAVAAMKAGADDYLMKGKLARLVAAVEHGLGDAGDRRERKRAEAALSASEVRYRRLFESAKDGILILNAETGRIVDVNPFLLEILGFSREEFLGKKIWELGFFKNIVANQASFAELQQQEHIRYEDKPLETADGRRIDVEFISNVYLMNHHKVIQCNIRDITTRKQAEERVREQAALLDTTSDAIYATALDGTIRFWNKGAEQTYGWSSAEALDRKATALLSIPGDDAADPLATVFQKGDWSGERRHQTKTGGEVVVFARLTLVRNAAGQPVSVFAIDTDITEKKQLDARFLQAQRLENLEALASGLAHDLNNVLAPVLLATAILRPKAQTEADRRILATMEASAQRGAAIVRQVLTFARGIEGKRTPLHPEHLLREMEAIARETFPKNIELGMDVEEDLWPVLGDATQLHQVLMNLCLNARDAMPEGGRLALTAENTDLDEAFALMTPGAKAGSYVRLSVSDTGTGIPPKLFDKLFDPFFTTKAPGKGTGLGLSAVLGIVKSHGGFLQFKSAVGKGTCFEIYLPAAPEAKPAVAPRPRTPPPRGQGELILVVDDEIAIRSVATGVLEEFGYRVAAASEGSEALAVFMQNRAAIAAVITDMLMPGMDGPTLVRVLRRIDPQIRIVGVSGMGEDTPVETLESLGLSALLTKPFTGESLLFALHAVLEAPPGTKVGHSGSPWHWASSTPWVPRPGSKTP
jgi:PAS domain S-box-containing protein